jgi:SAM-dependent methyltransferase
MNINERFWNTYYTTTSDDIRTESSFARFVNQEYLLHDNSHGTNKTIADLGCGNCRDCFFFARKGNTCFAIDYNLTRTETIENCIFIKENAVDVMRSKSKDIEFDIVYMRWFLHAMPYADALDVFNHSFDRLKPNGCVCIEVRSINDNELTTESRYDDRDKSFKTTHKRWPFSLERLIGFTKGKNCKIMYQKEGYFSPNENTETKNPLLIRFIVKKIH